MICVGQHWSWIGAVSRKQFHNNLVINLICNIKVKDFGFPSYFVCQNVTQPSTYQYNLQMLVSLQYHTVSYWYRETTGPTLESSIPSRVHFLCFALDHVTKISANERRRYRCNVFSHWLRPWSHDLRQDIEIIPRCITGYTMVSKYH